MIEIRLHKSKSPINSKIHITFMLVFKTYPTFTCLLLRNVYKLYTTVEIEKNI